MIPKVKFIYHFEFDHYGSPSEDASTLVYWAEAEFNLSTPEGKNIVQELLNLELMLVITLDTRLLEKPIPLCSIISEWASL